VKTCSSYKNRFLILPYIPRYKNLVVSYSQKAPYSEIGPTPWPTLSRGSVLLGKLIAKHSNSKKMKYIK
jgi:hypothetical protein